MSQWVCCCRVVGYFVSPMIHVAMVRAGTVHIRMVRPHGLSWSIMMYVDMVHAVHHLHGSCLAIASGRLSDCNRYTSSATYSPLCYYLMLYHWFFMKRVVVEGHDDCVRGQTWISYCLQDLADVSFFRSLDFGVFQYFFQFIYLAKTGCFLRYRIPGSRANAPTDWFAGLVVGSLFPP